MPDPTQELSRATETLTAGVRELQNLVGRLSSDVGGLVRLYQPATFTRFQFAVNDLTASIGRALVPVLEKATVLVRGIGDTIASLSGPGQALIAGLVAGGVAMGAMTVAVVALSAVVNSALGGIPVVLGAIAGAAVGVTLALKDFQQVQDMIQRVMQTGSILFNTLGKAAVMVFEAFAPILDLMANALVKNVETLSGFLARLIEPLKVVAGAVAEFMTAILSSSTLSSMLGVVQSLLGALLPLVQPLLQLVTAFVQVQKIITSIIAANLQVILTALTPLLTVFGAVLEVLLAPLVAITSALDEVRSAFDELMEVFRDLVSELMKLVTQELKAVLPDLVAPLKLVITALRDFAQWVRFIAREIRELFGLTSPALLNTFQKDASQGMAIRNTQQTSVSADLQKAQLAALAGGGKKNPADVTATNTSTIATDVRATLTLLQSWTSLIQIIASKGGEARTAIGLANPTADLGWRMLGMMIGKS